MYDVIDGLCRGLISPAELLTRSFWQYRKARQVLVHARSYLALGSLDAADRKALEILLDKTWAVEDTYVLRRIS
jgi:hypothetical protein